MADRMAQMESMDGAARCLETLRLQVSSFVTKFINESLCEMSKLIKFRNLISFVLMLCLTQTPSIIYI